MANLYGPRIVTDQLVFNMDFASPKCYPGSGSYCYDLSPNNFQGEIVSDPVYTTSVNNKYFDFSNDYIKIPNSTALDTQTPSVEVWIKTDATTQNGFWFEKGVVNSQYSLFQEGTSIQWRHNIGGITDLTTNAVSVGINTNDWFQVVGTYISGSRKLYINGVLKDSDTQSGTISTNSGGMSIGVYGGYAGSRGYYYNGKIAVVRVYTKELSSSEVLQNYNALKTRFI